MMDDETETCRVLFQNKINLRYCASRWFHYRKAYSFLADKKNSLRSVKPARLRHDLKIPSVHLILQHLDPIGISLSCIVKENFNINLLSTARFPK